MRSKKLGHIRERLGEFKAELDESSEPLDQFQAGYYVRWDEIEWMLDCLDEVEKMIPRLESNRSTKAVAERLRAILNPPGVVDG